MFTRLTTKEIDVLKPFFIDPELEASIRGLSRRSDVSPKWVSKTVSKLENKQVLEIEEFNRSKRVTTGRKFSEIKRRYNLDEIYDSGIIDFLEDQFRPDALVLFGSFEKGEDSNDSDIDIAIINGRSQKVELERFEKTLHREIELIHIESADEGEKTFRNSLANGTVLKGYLKLV